MAEENGNGYKVQINTNVAGDLFNFRAKDVAELKELLETAAGGDKAENVVEALVAFKQVFLANNVVAGTAVQTTQAAPVATSTAPPSPDGKARCKHGEVKDLTGQRNKAGKLCAWKFYCPAGFNAPDKCRSEDIPGNVKQV